MAKKETLGGYLNRNIKEKGSSLAAEKAKGKKYKSISAAKKAGALYYTNKSGQVMAAVYAEDLKVRPKAKPGGSAVSPRAGVGGGIFAGKGAGKDKAKAKSSTAQDNNPNKKLAGAGTRAKDSGDATRDDGPNVAPKRTGSKDKTSAARRTDSGVLKSLNKDLNAQRKASSAERRGPPSAPVANSGKGGKNKPITRKLVTDSGVLKRLEKDLVAQRKSLSAERRGPPSTPVKKRRDSKDNQSQSQSGISANAENTLKARLRQREADKRQREKDRRNKARSEAARLEKGLNSKPAERPRSNTRFPVGEVSSSRGRGDPDKIRAGDEKNALDTAAERRAIEKLMNMNKGGMTKGYNEGGLRMVKKGDEEVPFFAADGKGKMNKGGMTKKSGYMGGGMTKKKVMTYNIGGMVKSQTNNLKKGRS